MFNEKFSKKNQKSKKKIVQKFAEGGPVRLVDEKGNKPDENWRELYDPNGPPLGSNKARKGDSERKDQSRMPQGDLPKKLRRNSKTNRLEETDD